MFWQRTPEEERRRTRSRAVASTVGGLVLVAKGFYDLTQGGERAKAYIGAGVLFLAIGYLLRRAGADPT